MTAYSFVIDGHDYSVVNGEEVFHAGDCVARIEFDSLYDDYLYLVSTDDDTVIDSQHANHFERRPRAVAQWAAQAAHAFAI